MRYHAKKSIAMLVSTLLFAGIVAFFMITNYPSDGLVLADIPQYYSLYLIVLLVAIILNRLIVSGVFRLIYYKQKEQEPWQKEDQDIIVEYQGLVNVFLIGIIGLIIGFGLLYFDQPLPWFFIILFLSILAIEITYWLSVFMYNRKTEEEIIVVEK